MRERVRRPGEALEAQEFLVLGFILAAAVATGAAFGVIAFFRLERYRAALLEQAQRLEALEALLSGRLKAPTLPPPSLELTDTPAPVTAPPIKVPSPPPELVAPLTPPRAVPAAVAPPPVLRLVEHEEAPRAEVAQQEQPAPPASPAPLEGFRRTFDPPEHVAPIAQPLAQPVVAAPQQEPELDVEVPAEPAPEPEPELIEAPPEPAVAEEPISAAAAPERVDAEASPPPPPVQAPDIVTPEPVLAEPTPEPETVAAAAREPVVSRPEIVLWAGGAAITVGVIAALILAYRNGFFNELSQLLLGYLMAAAMIAGAEALRRRNTQQQPADWQTRHTPKILAAAGVACAWGMSYVGLSQLTLPIDVAMSISRLSMLSPGEALGLMGVSALGAFFLALGHGRLLAWLGLAMGFAAPLMVDAVPNAPPAFFAYLFAIAAAAFALARHRDWQGLAAAAAALALGWGVAWSLSFLLPSGMAAAGGYGVGLAALGVSYAWDHVAAPVDPAAAARLQIAWSPSAWVGVATTIGAVALLLTLAIRGEGAGGPAANALVIAVAMLSAAAAFREGLAMAPLAASTAALTALVLWPDITGPLEARAFAGTAGSLGLAASVGGWLMMGRNTTPGAGAMVAAIAPTATLLVAYLRLGSIIEAPFGWGGVALVLAAFNAFALDAISRAAGGAARAPTATAAFAAAAAACAVMAGAFAFDNVRMAAGVALLMAPLAWLDRRLNIPALRYAGAAFAAVTVALLSPIALVRAEIDPRPVANIIPPTFLIAIISLWASARLFALGPSGYTGRVTILVRIALIAVVLAFGFAEIRHLANGGDMNARYASLFEMGGHTAFLLAVACGIAWRVGGAERPLLQWTEAFAFVVATAHVLVAGFGILAPWWGTEPAPAPGALVFNALLAAYALPAALFALYAWLRARLGHSPLRVYVASGAAVACALVWLVLEVRRAFHPDAMAIGPVGPVEHGAFSLALVAASALIVAMTWQMERGPGAMALRVLAAALTAAGILKALALDIGFMEGAARYGAYALVAAAGVGALLGYHRYVFQSAPSSPGARASDATLLPPHA